jgi:hypothetical protein
MGLGTPSEAIDANRQWIRNQIKKDPNQEMIPGSGLSGTLQKWFAVG